MTTTTTTKMHSHNGLVHLTSSGTGDVMILRCEAGDDRWTFLYSADQLAVAPRYTLVTCMACMSRHEDD